MIRAIIVAIIACGVTASADAAEIFKCTNAAGRVEFRDTPCVGAPGQKIDIKDNGKGTGESLDSIRAQAAELNARQAARQAADERAAADRRADAQRSFYADRAHRDSLALQESINANANAPTYYGGFAYPYREPRQRREPERRPIKPVPAPYIAIK